MISEPDIVVQQERPDSAECIRLLASAEEYMKALYPAESNHLLSVAQLLAPSVTFLVARAKGDALGCGALVEAGEGFGEVKRMFVAADARGMGIGRKLMESIDDLARARGIHTIRLETGIYQPEAIRLYRRSGFAEIPAFPPYRPDPLSVFFAKRVL